MKIASCLRPRAERLLDEPDEAFGRFADIGLADQRQFGAVGAHDSRTEAQADIDGVREDGFARTRGCHEDIDHQGPLAAAGGIIGPDAAVGPAEQHASALPGRRRAIPWQHRQRVAEQRQGGVRRRRQRQTGGAAHHAFQRIADDRGRFRVAPTLDALRQCGYPAAQLRWLLDRRPGREAGAQLTLMWFSSARACLRKANARRRSALPGNIDRKLTRRCP